jgi:hypothetical protein
MTAYKKRKLEMMKTIAKRPFTIKTISLFCACLLVATSLVTFSGCGSVKNYIKKLLNPSESDVTTVDVNNLTNPPKIDVTPETDPAVRITELMVCNTVGQTDAYGNRVGWVEFYNCGSEDVNLADYKLSINGEDSVSLPSLVIAPGNYAVLFANGKNGDTDIPFVLPASGVLVLYHGIYATDKVSYLNASANCSYIPDTGSESSQPTPGYASVKEKDNLIISEFMSSNSLYPVKGKFCDWIELYNAGENSIDLSGYYLSNSADNLYRCNLSGKVIQPGEYLLLACGTDIDFNLSKTGEQIYVTRSDGVLAAFVSFDEIGKNYSWTYDAGITAKPSPGYPNNEDGYKKAISSRSGLLINEVISSNSKYYAVDGKYYDLVELKNTTDKALKLSDYYLSDKSSNLQRYHLPDVTLQPGEYYVVVCDGKNYAPFKISSDGEKLVVSRSDGTIEDALEIPAVPANRSYGRYNGDLVYFATPSFGKDNPKGYSELTATPTASVQSGFYQSSQIVTLSGSGTIYYTTDGSKPTTASKIYDGSPITVSENMSIRAIVYDGDKIPSEVTTFNYFISAPDYSLPVVKISMRQDDFDGSNGIYTKYNNTELEKEAGFAYYVNGVEQFSVNCGIKLFGASSRMYAKKSFQLKFRTDYGMSKLNYKLFDNLDITEFNNVVLRSGSQSIMKYRTMITDELVTSVASTSGYMPSVLTQAYKAVNLYINGEYMGIYFFREKIDEDFVANHWNVDPDSVTVINWVNTVKYGDSDQGWHDLWDFVATKKADLSIDENYQKVISQINVESFMDVYIMRMWGGDRDSGNIRAVKSPDYDGGRWNFILFDCDLCLDYGSTKDEIDYIVNNASINRLHTIFRALLKNDQFKEEFLKRLGYQMKNTLNPEKTQTRIDAVAGEIDADMKYNIERWKDYYHKTYADWKANVKTVRDRIGENRIKLLVKDAVKTFGLTEDDVRTYFGDEYVAYMN